MRKTVLILGVSGKIGSHCRAAFEGAGWDVRCYERKSNDMIAAARGVDVIVNGLNPPRYHDWASQIPAITESVIAAARTSGATVVIAGNVYNFGPRGGEWSEYTPQEPNTAKGRIRVEMERSYRKSGVRTLVLRAGNFIDPLGNGDVMSLLLMRSLRSGKLTSAGDPRVAQAYCYVPDWARAAVELAERRDELSNFEDIPFGGHTFSVEELREFLSARLGRSITITDFPWWLMSLTAPIWELAREMLEMRYLWSTAHWLSNTKFERLVPNFRATPRAAVMLAGVPAELRASITPHALSTASR